MKVKPTTLKTRYSPHNIKNWPLAGLLHSCFHEYCMLNFTFGYYFVRVDVSTETVIVLLKSHLPSSYLSLRLLSLVSDQHHKKIININEKCEIIRVSKYSSLSLRKLGSEFSH